MGKAGDLTAAPDTLHQRGNSQKVIAKWPSANSAVHTICYLNILMKSSSKLRGWWSKTYSKVEDGDLWTDCSYIFVLRFCWTTSHLIDTVIHSKGAPKQWCMGLWLKVHRLTLCIKYFHALNIGFCLTYLMLISTQNPSRSEFFSVSG